MNSTLSPKLSFAMGKYRVSPLVRLTDAGRFSAAVSIRSGQGQGTHDRIFRFVPDFPTWEGARRYAARQGVMWVRTPQPAL